MLAGEVQRCQGQIASLVDQVDRFSQKIAALDSSIVLADSRVNPEALGCVTAQSEKYGGRGGPTNFIKSEVCAAGSSGISTAKMTLLAASRFDIQIYKPSDLDT